MIINRSIKQKIIDNLYRGKVIRLYGLRRSGKTTLCQSILEQELGAPMSKSNYYNCEILRHKNIFETLDPDIIKNYLGNAKLVVLDEAQNISRIGLMLKLMVDTYPDIQIIATGSSSFELANQSGEPLVGRAYTYILHPITIQELKNHSSEHEIITNLDTILRYGLMPGVAVLDSDYQKAEYLDTITTSYLYKDILEYENVKNSGTLVRLLKALALQIGGQISYREIGQLIDLNPQSVEKYIDLLEQSFIIFRLTSFSRNLRNELKRASKIYFWDIGIRNSLIQNFNQLDSRGDIGAIWENFCVSEKLKLDGRYQPMLGNNYFWRTSGNNAQEIDLIIDRDGTLNCIECKYSPKKTAKVPTQFSDTYKNFTYTVINSANFVTELSQLIP